MNQIATASSPTETELASKLQQLPAMALLNCKGDLETSAQSENTQTPSPQRLEDPDQKGSSTKTSHSSAKSKTTISSSFDQLLKLLTGL